MLTPKLHSDIANLHVWTVDTYVNENRSEVVTFEHHEKFSIPR